MKKCKHENADHLMPGDLSSPGHLLEPFVAKFEQIRCLDCGAWLSLGNSDETGLDTEIRAAELAAFWEPIGGVTKIVTDDESRGWSGWPYRQPENDGEHTGFLAAQILMHERDLGDVNWAGHHMADHPISNLIARSSIGEGLRNIRENGIEAELDDLDKENG